MKFNLNQKVKVKLTDVGLGILESQHRELNLYRSECHRTDFIKPKVDDKGYSTFQMHDLMNRFGSYCSLGLELPFHPDVILLAFNGSEL